MPTIDELFDMLAALPKPPRIFPQESKLLEKWAMRQFRFPRSKRKRIQRKWRKDKANYRNTLIEKSGPYLMQGSPFFGGAGTMWLLYAPSDAAKLKEILDMLNRAKAAPWKS